MLILETKEKIWQRNYVKWFNKSCCKRDFCAVYILARMVEIQHGALEMALRILGA